MQTVQLELSKIRPADGNSKARVGDVGSLAKSIDAVGLLNPIHVIQEGPEGNYEIVAGHRRYEAVKKIGRKEIDAIVMDLDDAGVTTVRLTENIHRKQLTPFEEADAIEMLENIGREPSDIAADLGMTPQAVARRRQLNKLTPEWRKYIDNIKEGQELSVAAFELIASYEPSVQGKLLQKFNKTYRVPTVAMVKGELSEFDRQLKSAPWKLDDATLHPRAGACTECPKRSSCQPLLFEGETDSKKAKLTDRCLDIACWNNKLKRYGKRKLEEAKEKHPDLVLLKKETGWGPSRNRAVSGLSRGHRVLESGYWGEKTYEPAKKSDKDSVPAMTINEKGLGRISYVRILREEKVKQSKPAAKKLTPKEKAKQEADELKARRERWIKDMISDLLGWQSELPAHLISMNASDLVKLFGSAIAWSDKYTSSNGLPKWKGLSYGDALTTLWRVLSEAEAWHSYTVEGNLVLAEHLLGLKREDLEAQAMEAIPDPQPKTGTTESKKSSTKKQGKKAGKK